MGIKNFFVKVESVKSEVNGLRNIIKYYDNEEHKNHKGRTTIIQLYENKTFFDRVVKSVEQKNTDLKIVGKGGRPIKTYGYSYCFGTPKGIEVSKQKWEQISRDIINSISKKSGIPIEKLKPYIKFNIHSQDNQHLNILLGSVIDGKKFDFSRKEYLNMLKQQFNLSCLNVLGLNHKTYEVQKKVVNNPKIQKMVDSAAKPKTENIYHYKNMEKQFFEFVEQLTEIDNKTKDYVKKLSFHIKQILLNDGDIIKHKEQLQRKIDKLQPTIKKTVKQSLNDDYGIQLS